MYLLQTNKKELLLDVVESIACVTYVHNKENKDTNKLWPTYYIKKKNKILLKLSYI
jgi:hypothetical protein